MSAVMGDLQRRARLQLDKFYGRCLMPDGDRVTLVVWAKDHSEAGRALHAGYRIEAVLELHTKEEYQRVRQDIRYRESSMSRLV